MPRKRTLEGVSERRRYKRLATNETPGQRQQRLATLRNSQRASRLRRIDQLQPQTTTSTRNEATAAENSTQPTTSTSSQLQRLKIDIERTRVQDKLPMTYCCARLLQKDCDVTKHSVGPMNKICKYCGAKLFSLEVSEGSSSLCCHKGKINVPEVVVCDELKTLLERNDNTTKNYLDNIRQFNSALAMASVQVNSVHVPGRGPFCFKIHGQMYHMIGGLQPPAGHNPSYAGLFIMDSDEALEQRLGNVANTRCDPEIMAMLQTMLTHHNPYAQIFKFVKHYMVNAPDVQLQFTTENAFDPRRYNLPTTSQVAAVFISDDGAPPGQFHFVVYSKSSGALTRISYLNPHSDPMCYPLLFPCGDSGWKPGMPHVNIHRTAVRTVTTQLQYYCYRLAVRGTFNLIHYSGKLFQQYVVDSYVKVEGSRIAYVRSHQKELRAENYKGLTDFIHSNAQQRGMLPGIPVVLPSSFIGSARNMLQNYQDAMSIVARFGKPDIFLTFTCNPNWPEITGELQPFEQVQHRSDLITRVFSLKLKSLLDDLLKKHVLGVVISYVYVIEFQKRGLPHAHILLMLRQSDKLTEDEHVDSLITAEIPDPQTDPILYNIVKKCMIHNPCGQINPNLPCMKDGQCTKGFPKDFNDQTNLNVNGYPLYRRTDNGINFVVGESVVDNRWIVPYNRYLTLKYDAHINVEICSSVRSVKYLYKYVYKGHDCASVRLHNNPEDQQQISVDEINLYLDCRYVSPPEAIWRLHERRLFDRSHAIVRLPVHLEEEQMIYFEPGRDLEANMNKATKLTAYFKLCEKEEIARQYLYSEIPEHYTWIKDEWKPRKRFANSIGRIYTVNPADRERYFLRVLLLHVKGATSYAHLRTVDGTLCTSFLEAAEKLHLVDNDQEWVDCLQEATNFKMPQQLRELFAIVCLFCTPTNIPELWETFHEQLSEDFRRTHDVETSKNFALHCLEDIFKQHGHHCEDFGLPKPTDCNFHDDGNRYNIEEENQKGMEAYAKLNNEQQQITDDILQAVRSATQRLMFIDGPGGTGKTFLYRTLCHILRGEDKVVLPVAWTGIAANLLPGGRTSHSLFKLPVPILDTSVSSIRPYSKQADLLRRASLIIWDEVSMVPKHALGIVDRLLRDISNVNTHFGGKTIVFGGDFRQVLPVVRHGNRTTIIEANIQQSPLWRTIQKRKLSQNMRTDDPEFSNWLLQLGNGELEVKHDVSPNTVKIPKTFYCDENEIIAKVFPTGSINANNVNDFINTAILCPKNEDCTKINEHIVQNIVEGDCKVYYSCDSVQSDEGTDNQLYPLEFLNSLNPSGLPTHKLILKKNTIVMLIRNLNAKQGLINGARMVVTHLHEYTVTARLIDSGKTVVIPRINLTPSDPTMPFQMTRRQFPLKVAFAMTINKSQGQTLQRAGLYLPNAVFTHGQLYVAFSRVTKSNNIFVSITENDKQKIQDDCILTSNIVYKEVL